MKKLFKKLRGFYLWALAQWRIQRWERLDYVAWLGGLSGADWALIQERAEWFAAVDRVVGDECD